MNKYAILTRRISLKNNWISSCVHFFKKIIAFKIISAQAIINSYEVQHYKFFIDNDIYSALLQREAVLSPKIIFTTRK